MSNKSIIFLIAIILSCPCIFASKEWNEIECNGIDDIVFYMDGIYPFSDNLNHYFFNGDDLGFVLYKFEANKNTATLTNCDIYANYKNSNFWSDGTYIYHLETPSPETYTFVKQDIKNGDEIRLKTSVLRRGNGFFIDGAMYYLDNENGKLYSIWVQEGEEELLVFGNDIQYTPTDSTSIAVLNNTFYYFSSNGFVASTISDFLETDSKLIEKVNTKESESTLLTDGDSKIWIINKSDGVIEYNTKNNTVETIAKLPNITRIDNSRGFFYSQNMIYLLDCNTKKVYTLDVSGSTPPTPPTPPTPGNGHDQSGKTCGCLGFEFIFVLVTVFTLRLFKH